MSGFDVQLRSQELTFPLRQRGAEHEAQAVGQLGQIPQQQVEWAQQKAESDAKIQAFQIERQLQQQKLKEMQFLDQAGLSRLQVDQQRIANETMAEQARALRQQNDQAQKSIESGDYAQQQRLKIAELKAKVAGDPSDWYALGMVIDQTSGLPRAPKDPQELADFKERAQQSANMKARGYVGQSAIATSSAALDALKKELASTDASIKQLSGFSTPNDADKQELQNLRTLRKTQLSQVNEWIQILKQTLHEFGGLHTPAATTPAGATDYGSDEALEGALKYILQGEPSRRSK